MGVVETTTFRLRPGTSDETFLALDRRVQTELIPNQPGFVRRTTAHRGEDWLIVTLWYSDSTAIAFEAVAAGHPIQVEFDGLVDAGSLQRRRYETLD